MGRIGIGRGDFNFGKIAWFVPGHMRGTTKISQIRSFATSSPRGRKRRKEGLWGMTRRNQPAVLKPVTKKAARKGKTRDGGTRR